MNEEIKIIGKPRETPGLNCKIVSWVEFTHKCHISATMRTIAHKLINTELERVGCNAGISSGRISNVVEYGEPYKIKGVMSIKMAGL